MYDQNQAENEYDEMRNGGWWQLQFGQISLIEEIEKCEIVAGDFFLAGDRLANQFPVHRPQCIMYHPPT